MGGEKTAADGDLHQMKRRIALTGGIACGKSLVASMLNELGIETIDADDIVHELIPEEERRRLAEVVFKDAAARKQLEARIHPLVKERIDAFLDAASEGRTRIAVIPLLFETHWDEKYDIICCVSSTEETQISRMVAGRGWTRAAAEARLRAQLPLAEKAEKSHYVINNCGSVEELRRQTERFASWLMN